MQVQPLHVLARGPKINERAAYKPAESQDNPAQLRSQRGVAQIAQAEAYQAENGHQSGPGVQQNHGCVKQRRSRECVEIDSGKKQYDYQANRELAEAGKNFFDHGLATRRTGLLRTQYAGSNLDGGDYAFGVNAGR